MRLDGGSKCGERLELEGIDCMGLVWKPSAMETVTYAMILVRKPNEGYIVSTDHLLEPGKISSCSFLSCRPRGSMEIFHTDFKTESYSLQTDSGGFIAENNIHTIN